MTHHESSVVINRPIDEVWRFAVEPFNVPRWGGGRLQVHVAPPGPAAVGSTIRQRFVFLGFEAEIRTTITEWKVPHAAAHSVTDARSGVFRSATFRTTLEAVAGGTRVVRMAEAEPRGIWRLFWPFLAPIMKRRMDAQTRNLKRLIETQ